MDKVPMTLTMESRYPDARVLLAYVSYPVTTAVYLERALRARKRVVTIGPTMDKKLIEAWQLENMHLPIRDLDIPVAADVDMATLVNRLPSDMLPDLYFWVESINGYFPKNLDALRRPKACYLINSHLNLQWHVEWAKQFDHVFIAQREYLQAFRDAGNSSVHWLPLGCDPGIHRKTTPIKEHAVGFAGSVNTERRVKLLNSIAEVCSLTYKRVFWEDMADLFSQSRIVFNNAVRNDLNMRVFEALSTGSFLLTDVALASGQEELFRAGEDLGVYTDDAITEAVSYYLNHEDERERIARRGQQIIHNGHTYAHRLDDMFDVVLGGRSTTPSSVELRERSVAGLAPSTQASISNPASANVRQQRRSFVIPVLDMSPASPFNITTLLNDLQRIEGDVIVVFNSVEMADRLRAHTRIDYSAVMSHNVGVGRAWNIGLAMSQSPVTFILNADLHIEPALMETLEESLETLPNAAIVGPQGGFVHFGEAKDLMYFDKGTLQTPTEVDNVSGFLFAVRTELFHTAKLQVDPRFTPCYFEEWDLGLQCRRHGLRCYVVPATGYDHEWSGSIRALRTIRYYRQEETSRDILSRNRTLFLKKWRDIAGPGDEHRLLESRWIGFCSVFAENLRAQGKQREAEVVIAEVLRVFPRATAELLDVHNAGR
jgi:hypothetical protein